MAQKLIMPINKATITASYKNLNYKNQFRYTHFGMDIISSDTNPKEKDKIYACGNGIVTHCGYDDVLGNIIVIVYDSVNIPNVILPRKLTGRCYHLAQINVRVGQRVTKDDVIGLMGNTGSVTTGKHLHFELDTDVNYPQYSQTLGRNSNIIKAGIGVDTTLNPAKIYILKQPLLIFRVLLIKPIMIVLILKKPKDLKEYNINNFT